MTKSEIIKTLFPIEEQGKFDTAVPQPWADKVIKLQVDPYHYIWDYREYKLFGKPLNIVEAYGLYCIKKKSEEHQTA